METKESELRPDVVAGKKDHPEFDKDGLKLLVNDIFYTVQGEGAHAGVASVFIRLAKCNLKCAFCDTEFETGKLMAIGDILKRVSEVSIAAGCTQPNRVVLTGGEPALQPCGTLLTMLHARGIKVDIETSGSVWSEWMRKVNTLTVSPKVRIHAMPAALVLEMHSRADMQAQDYTVQVKWIVNKSFANMMARDKMDVYFSGVGLNLLQPESQKPENTKLAIDLALLYPYRYRLCIQMHKYVGMP